MHALITGASSGIGLELARIFAQNGHDVVLVARHEEKLQALATELTARNVRAQAIAIDLAAHDGAASLVAQLQARGIDVDILVNNAGFGLYGPFVETALATELSMIQLNVVALTELTKRLLPGMIARRRGRIMNVASTAAFFPGPLMAVYYATKAYVLSFSEAIANELDGSGVTVTALCPGPTASGFQAAASLEESKLVAGRKLPTAREVAQDGFDAVMAGRPLVVTGWSNKLLVLTPRFFPRRAIARVVRAAQERRKN
jgi:uncharacterized protein